jgi:hypothetical protein
MQSPNISTHLKYIYLLLFLAWVVNQLNLAYRFDLTQYNNVLSPRTEEFIETFSELSLSTLAAYILYTFIIENKFLKFFIVFFTIFYFIDGILSAVIVFDPNNKTVNNINETFFNVEYHFTRFVTFGLLFTIYETIFKI